MKWCPHFNPSTFFVFLFVQKGANTAKTPPMKPLIAFATLLALTGCSTVRSASTNDSETVMVTYHVQPGDEAEFEKLLAHAWEVYRGEQMVFAEPHTLVRQTDGGKTNFIEIFTWIHAPDRAPNTVKSIWAREQSLCEKRNGKNGIDFSEVQLVEAK